MTPPPPADATATYLGPTPSVLDEGLRLVLDEQDATGLSPLARWLAANPQQAGDLAQLLATANELHLLLHRTSTATRQIADFEIRGVIGRGGMGIVYHAYDRTLKRDVALKQIPPEVIPSVKDRARFQYEAEAIASLDHPNIVRVFAFGEWNESPYLVMPLMTGGSLATHLQQRTARMPPEDAARLLQAVALGVHHAHERGLLHRDLKPGNILLDGAGCPHVADFGLARPLHASVTAAVAGTAAYMAPEQARGEKYLTTATDIHALGAILYELLAGQPPYGTGAGSTILRRLTDDPVPSLSRTQPDLPTALATICRRCLEKEPKDRYPSALALSQDLQRFLNGEPLAHSASSFVANIQRALGRRRETFTGMLSWPIAFVAAAHTLVSIGLLQVAVLTSAARWPAQAALAWHLGGWMALVWLFWARRPNALSRGESATMTLHLGLFLAGISLSITALVAANGAVLPLLPALGAVVGFALFAHGLFFWGRLYLVGFLATVGTTLMPLFPQPYWPTIYGVLLTSAQLWAGAYVIRRDERS